MLKGNGHSNSNILIGILAGTVVGAVTAAAICSPKTKELTEDLVDTFERMGKKVSGAAQHLSESAYDLPSRFLGNNKQSRSQRNMTIGAIAGGILGLSAIVFLSSRSAKDIRKQIFRTFDVLRSTDHPFEDIAHFAAERFGNNITPWMKKVEKFLNAINENEYFHSKKQKNNHPFDKILDWAVAAAQTYQSFKK